MNNRYRNVPGLRSSSKATASTLCQKCLKRDIFECTVSAQERPYISRPSRTQQLQNPKLIPRLSSDTPNDLLQSKGVADDLLAKREEERGRKRDLDDPDLQPSKRARSASSHSVSSVSTISTRRSPSQSPTHEDSRARSSRGRERSLSPRHSRSRKRQYSHSSSGYTSRSPSGDPYDRNTRRRRREHSPKERGRSRDLPRGGGRRYRSRSRSMDQSRIAKERRSMTPETVRGRDYPRRPSSGDNGAPADHSYRPSNHSYGGPSREGYAPAQSRDRSLSPYSKRLALTQAMNMAR